MMVKMKRLILYFALWFSIVSTAHCVHFYDSVVERGSLVSLAVVPPELYLILRMQNPQGQNIALIR